MKVVIGAGWGDESKGKHTDYFARPNGLVVRYNGGGQAGHTVQTPEGYRHVFKHFGSGTLKGASTLLAREFIVNPFIFTDEGMELVGNDFVPREFMIDYRCKVTTPYDMMINQMIEESRGYNRHGSCGEGINETIRRHEQGFDFTVMDLFGSEASLKDHLNMLREHWVPLRLDQLGLKLSDKWKSRMDNENMLKDYIFKARIMIGPCIIVEDDVIVRREGAEDHIVFEGAQGLMLDQNNRDHFPHLTPSNTGLQNVMKLIGYNEPIEAVYATRAYATRHGAGPFREEPSLKYEDKTNIPNDWQNSMRFGYLDVDVLANAIRNDLKRASVNVTPVIAVSCLDQVGEEVVYGHEGELFQAHPEALIHTIEIATGLPVKYVSYGPTRNDIEVR